MLGRVLTEKNLAKNTRLCYIYDSLSRVVRKVTENLTTNSSTEAIYFEGDFTKSIEYINKLVNSLTSDNNKQYNLLFNNCLQVSVEALMEGTFDKYDSEYKIALSYALSVSTPNAAYVGMSQFDAMIDNHMKKNGFLKYFSDPYFGFKPYIIRQD